MRYKAFYGYNKGSKKHQALHCTNEMYTVCLIAIIDNITNSRNTFSKVLLAITIFSML